MVEVVVALGVVDGAVVGVAIAVGTDVGVPPVAVGDGTSLDTTAIGETIIEVNDVVDKTDADADAAAVAVADCDVVVSAGVAVCIKVATTVESSC